VHTQKKQATNDSCCFLPCCCFWERGWCLQRVLNLYQLWHFPQTTAQRRVMVTVLEVITKTQHCIEATNGLDCNSPSQGVRIFSTSMSILIGHSNY
jgi:hypothetical protein